MFFCCIVAAGLTLASGPNLQASSAPRELPAREKSRALDVNRYSAQDTSPDPTPKKLDLGFLSNTCRDWLALIGTIGLFATLASFIIAIFTLNRTTTATKAATAAALEALNRSRDRYNQHVVVQATGLIQDARRFVESGEWSRTVLRLGDLATLIEQSPRDDDEWSAFGGRLRKMGESFSRVCSDELSFSQSLKRGWQKLATDLSSKLSELSTPFPLPDEDRTHDK